MLNTLPVLDGIHQRVIAAVSPEIGTVLFNITQPMLAATLVEVSEVKYVYMALNNSERNRTSIVKV